MYSLRLICLIPLFLIWLPSEPVGASTVESSVTAMPQMAHIALTVRVDYESERIAGTARLSLQNTSTVPISRVPLLLNRLLRVSTVTLDGGQKIAHRQQVTSFEDLEKWQVNAIEITLPQPLSPGASVQLSVVYEGHLVGYTEVGLRYVKDHISREFTILREDAFAFPVIGVPSIQAIRSARREPFEFEVSATVPEGLVVATGGEQLSHSILEGWSTWHSRSRMPAPFLVIAIAPYGVLESDDLQVFHFQADEDGAQMLLSAAQQAKMRYQEIFGPLAQPSTLNVIQIPNGWGSQASLAGGIIQEAGAFRDRSQLAGLYHELSHLWNAPDTDQPSSRWNEGLAMFLQDRLSRELDGWEGASDAWHQTATGLIAQCNQDRPCGRIPFRQYGKEGLTDYSYSVGRLMFATLYSVLGEDTFDRALRQHFQTHQTSGTSADQLIQTFVEIGGSAAQHIFNDWFETTQWRDRLQDNSPVHELFEYYRRQI